MITCKVVINKHENICVGVYWSTNCFVTPSLPLDLEALASGSCSSPTGSRGLRAEN